VKTILVVDDEEAVVEFIGSLLEEEDYRILRAYDGRSALEIARNEHPDLILSDIMMPIKNGLEFCRQLRETPETADIPVILMTAGRSTDHACPGATVLPKPFDLNTLEEVVARKLAEPTP
jgi:CheY-like chemotaxis protein